MNDRTDCLTQTAGLKRTAFVATVHSHFYPGDVIRFEFHPSNATLHCEYWRSRRRHFGLNQVGSMVALERLYISGSVQIKAADTSMTLLIEGSWSTIADKRTDGAILAQVSVWNHTDSTCDQLFRVRESTPSE